MEILKSLKSSRFDGDLSLRPVPRSCCALAAGLTVSSPSAHLFCSGDTDLSAQIPERCC